MESTNTSPQADGLDLKTRTYFLQQGQSISKLYDILKNNLMIGIAKWGISILLEVILYLTTLAIWLAVALYLPNGTIEVASEFDENTTLYAGMKHEQLTELFMMVKVGAIIVSLIPFTLARLLRRNRIKRSLIRTAYEEVAMMKERFDTAVKELKL